MADNTNNRAPEINDIQSDIVSAAAAKPKGLNIPYERRKQLYGYGFIALWFVGSIYFFIAPLIQSLIYSFHQTKIVTGGMQMSNPGFKNYYNAFRKDQYYVPALTAMIKDTLLNTPLIIVFSVFIAVILNQKFKGRTAARAIFFLPVIIATGPVIDIIINKRGITFSCFSLINPINITHLHIFNRF